MKRGFTLLLVVLCFAQFVSTGSRRGGRGTFWKLKKEIEDLTGEISYLTEDAKECIKEKNELNDKISKLLTTLAQSK